MYPPLKFFPLNKIGWKFILASKISRGISWCHQILRKINPRRHKLWKTLKKFFEVSLVIAIVFLVEFYVFIGFSAKISTPFLTPATGCKRGGYCAVLFVIDTITNNDSCCIVATMFIWDMRGVPIMFQFPWAWQRLERQVNLAAGRIKHNFFRGFSYPTHGSEVSNSIN